LAVIYTLSLHDALPICGFGPMTLTGRVAIVTGRTGALGQAVTRRLLAEGATVAAPFIVDAERDRLQAGVDATAKDRLLLVRADVTDERAVRDLVNPLQAPHPRLRR